MVVKHGNVMIAQVGGLRSRQNAFEHEMKHYVPNSSCEQSLQH